MTPAQAREAPFGAWPSPVSAEALAAASIGVSELRTAGGRLHWLENRPAEGGRNVLVAEADGEPEILTPAPYNVRTRVHEYGGAPYLVRSDAILFSNFADQRLHRLAPGAPPVPLTPKGYRYADAVSAPDGSVLAVREDHTDPGEVRNAIVRLTLAAGDAGAPLFSETDFVAYPRARRDGRVAWIAWSHPNMPWDDTTLFEGQLDGGRLTGVRAVAGFGGESVLEPVWGEDGALYFLSDRTGFWNVWRAAGGETRPVIAAEREFGGPLWGLGAANLAALAGGRIAARRAEPEGDVLLVMEPASGDVREIPIPFRRIGSLCAPGPDRIACLAASADAPPAVVEIPLDGRAPRIVRRPSSSPLEPASVSHAEPVVFESVGGRTVHALYYPPKLDGFRGPAGEAPPMIVQAHGGPTGQASDAFSLSNQFWTTRGFAILDVDYSGSSGYGRAYRKRLEGQWGVADVEDVVAGARSLAAEGRADPRRIAIHGGSAGGFTVLAALATSDVFGAGASYYGVADLEALARDTHKFESRYLDGLVGPWPEARETYLARSPLSRLDGFSAPLIIFQGSEDPVVPPNQAHMIRDALRARRLPVAYMEFPGESHGFRKAETIIASKTAELAFYGRVFGFAPAGPPVDLVIENLDPQGEASSG